MCVWGGGKESYLPKISALNIFIYFPPGLLLDFHGMYRCTFHPCSGFPISIAPRHFLHPHHPSKTSTPKEVQDQRSHRPAPQKGVRWHGHTRTHLQRGALEAIKPEIHSPIIHRGKWGRPSVGTAGEGMGSRYG